MTPADSIRKRKETVEKDEILPQEWVEEDIEEEGRKPNRRKSKRILPFFDTPCGFKLEQRKR